MVKAVKKPKAGKAKAKPAPRKGVAQDGGERALLRLIADPCHAPLVNGYSLGVAGIVQRFSKFYKVPDVAGETAFSVYVQPMEGTIGVTTTLFTSGTGFTNTGFPLPHADFATNNADRMTVLAACVEVLYQGTVLERKGIMGLVQTNHMSLRDAVSTPGTGAENRMAFSQFVAPVTQHPMEAKWIPTAGNLTAAAFTEGGGGINDSNGILFTFTGVDPTQFTVRVTTVIEYIPKVTLGQLAPRPTREVPPGAPQRMAAAMDRAGHWWASVGEAAHAGMRLASGAFHALESGVRLARGVTRMAPAALALLG